MTRPLSHVCWKNMFEFHGVTLSRDRIWVARSSAEMGFFLVFTGLGGSFITVLGLFCYLWPTFSNPRLFIPWPGKVGYEWRTVFADTPGSIICDD